MWYTMNMYTETMITYIFLVCDLGFVVILAHIIYHSVNQSPVWHFNLRLTFLLLYAMEYEVYREMLRLVGWQVGVSELRVRYLCGLYLLIGLFLREVMYNAERFEVSLFQGRADL